jgi:hypothetical protein
MFLYEKRLQLFSLFNRNAEKKSKIGGYYEINLQKTKSYMESVINKGYIFTLLKNN